MSSLRIAASMLLTLFACVIQGHAVCAQEPGPPETWLARLHARRATLRAEFTAFATKQLEFFRPRSDRDGKALLADVQGEAKRCGELLAKYLEERRADKPPPGLEAVAKADSEAIEAASARLERVTREGEAEIMERWAFATLAGEHPLGLLQALAEATFGAGSPPSGTARTDLEGVRSVLSDAMRRDHIHLALACLRMHVMDAAPESGVKLLFLMSRGEMARAPEDEADLDRLAHLELSPFAAEFAGALSDLIQVELVGVWKTSLALKAGREDWFGGSTSMTNHAYSRRQELGAMLARLLGRELEAWEMDLFAARDRFASRPEGQEHLLIELRRDGAKVELRRSGGEWADFEEEIAGLTASLGRTGEEGARSRRGWIQIGSGVSIGHVIKTIEACFDAGLHDIGWGAARK